MAGEFADLVPDVSASPFSDLIPKPSFGDRIGATASELARQAGLTGRYLIEGGTGLASLLASPINAALGLESPGTAVSNLLTRAGFPEPQTTGERLIGDASRAVAGAATGIGLGGVLAGGSAPLAQGIGNVMQSSPGFQAVSAGAGGFGAGAARELGGGPISQFAAGLVGSLTPGVSIPLGSASLRGAIRGGEAGRQNYIDRLSAFQDAGINPPSAGQASGMPGVQVVESGLSRLPGAASVFSDQAAQEAAQMGARVNDLADQYMPAANATKAGLAIGSGIKDFVSRFRGEQNFLYDKLDQYIPPDTIVPATNVLAKVRQLTTPIPGAAATSGIIATPRMGTLGEALAADAAPTPSQPILSSLIGPNGQPIVTGQTVATAGGMPYQALKQLRSAVGAKIDTPSLTDDIPTGQWKQIYGALSADMQQAAQAAGPDAMRAFNRANAYSAAGYGRIDGILSKVTGNQAATAEQIFQAATNPSAMQQGGTVIGTVMKSLQPDERNAVTAAVVKRMGIAVPGQQNDLGDVFSSQTFLTNWNRMSPQAKMYLFSNPGLRDSLDQVANAASMIKQGSAVFANPSGTAGAAANIGTGLALGQSLLTGHLGAAGGIVGGLLAGKMSASLLTNPSFVQWLAKTTTLPPALIPAQINQIAQYANANWSAQDKAALGTYLSGIATPGSSPQTQQTAQ